jgi:HAMP domain-containing protein
MAVGLRILLVLACLVAALVSGGLLLVVALGDAETRLVATLQGKAGVHARGIKQDIEVALDLGVPLHDIRQVSEYLEQGVQEDPDIRFAAVTDLELERWFYGGMGRRRLDPLLDAPRLRQAIAQAPHALTEGVAGVEINGFSLTATPLVQQGSPVGFVVVAVQNKQVFDHLVEHLTRLLPALVAIVLLLTELGLATAAGVLEAPLARLAHLMDRVSQGQAIERSGRHDRSEIGMALLRFNGIVYRLVDRAHGVLALADEVQRAVFDAAVAGQVARRAEDLRASAAKPLLGAAIARPDARSSDIHLSVTLLFAAGAFGLVVAFGAGSGVSWIWPAAGLLAGVLLAAVARAPGWGLVLAGVVLIAATTLWSFAPPMAAGLVAAGLAGGLGATLVAGWLYQRHGQGGGRLWLLLRFGLGSLAGGLMAWTVVLEGRVAIAALMVLAAVALAAVAANQAAVVRARLFERSVGTG